MERIFLTIITLLSVFATPGKAGDPNSVTNEYELAYQRWHAEMAKFTDSSSSIFFDTENGPPGLVAAVKQIKGYGLRMADFMCEKMANDPYYQDIFLLDAITGINLWYGDDPNDNIGKNMKDLSARFREEWRAGLYEHPDQKVAELLEPLVQAEPITVINPRQLANVTRYGVYGVPELIRQIKKHNSATAFALYLRATGEMIVYGKYLKKPHQLFITKDEKLKHIEDKVKEWKAKGDDKERVVIKIDAALKE